MSVLNLINLYQLQRDYFSAKADRLIVENTKDREIFDDEVKKIQKKAEEIMNSCQAEKESFVLKYAMRLEVMKRGSDEVNRIKRREERRRENRREKRLRKKQRQAQNKTLNQRPTASIAGEE